MNELKYYIALFKIQGHETWRMANAKDLKTLELNMGKNVTDKKVFVADRLTGELKPL